MAPPLKGLANGLLERLPDRPGHLAPQATQKTKATFSLGVRSWGGGRYRTLVVGPREADVDRDSSSDFRLHTLSPSDFRPHTFSDSLSHLQMGSVLVRVL